MTEKEKKFGKMNDIYLGIVRKSKLEDFVNVQKDFEEMNKLHAKCEKLILSEGQPDSYILCIICIQNMLESLNSLEKQKLSKTNNKAYNILQQ